jgi:hypothetical protein
MDEEENKIEQPDMPEHFYIVILRADGEFGVEEFNALEAMTERMKDLIDHDVSVFSFAGARLQISKPPFRHLLTPWGNLPLFDVPKDNFEPDDTGYLGSDPIHLETPPEIKTQGSNKPSTNPDDFFSDEDENTINVFDNILPDPDS